MYVEIKLIEIVADYMESDESKKNNIARKS
jgi:hypothetical protein